MSSQGGSSTSSEVRRNECISTRDCIAGIVITVVLALAGYLSYINIRTIYSSEPWLGIFALFLFAPAEISFVYFLLRAYRPGSSKLIAALAVAFLTTSAGFILWAYPMLVELLEEFFGGWLIVVSIGTLAGAGLVVYSAKRNESISKIGCIVGIVLTVMLAVTGYVSFVILGMIYYSESWLGFLFLFLMTPAEISFVYFFLWAFKPSSSKLTVALAVAFLILCVFFILWAYPILFSALKQDGGWLNVAAIGTLILLGAGSVVYMVTRSVVYLVTRSVVYFAKRRRNWHLADKTDDYPPFRWED